MLIVSLLLIKSVSHFMKQRNATLYTNPGPLLFFLFRLHTLTAWTCVSCRPVDGKCEAVLSGVNCDTWEQNALIRAMNPQLESVLWKVHLRFAGWEGVKIALFEDWASLTGVVSIDDRPTRCRAAVSLFCAQISLLWRFSKVDRLQVTLLALYWGHGVSASHRTRCARQKSQALGVLRRRGVIVLSRNLEEFVGMLKCECGENYSEGDAPSNIWGVVCAYPRFHRLYSLR